MDLKEYLYRNDLTGDEFAKLIGISPNTLYKYFTYGWLGKPTCKKIEAATKGQVTVKELRKIYLQDS